MRHNFFGNMHFGEVDLFGFLLITLIVIIIISIFNFTRSKNHEKKDLSISQKEVLDNFESLVFAMLAQQGSELTQQEISYNLKLPIEIVSENLNQMKKEKKIVREWINEEYTYKVKLI